MFFRIAKFLVFASLLLAAGQQGLSQQVDVWFGTTTPKDGLSLGIYHSTLNLETGKLSAAKLAAEADNPGFLALHPQLDLVYCVGNREGGKPAVANFKIEAKGNLSEIGHQLITDGGAAHLAIDRDGSILATAQYGGGSVTVFSLDSTGSIVKEVQVIEHDGGSKIVGRRQDSPHPHWVGFDMDNRFAFVPDLGMDEVVIYRFDKDKKNLTPHGTAKCPPGSGPRHMKFHPDGRFAFVLNELSLSISVFEYDNEKGKLELVQTVKTLSDEIKSKEAFNSASEIRVHPTGRFVFSANRGHDSISVFRCDSQTGKLTLVEVEPIRGSWPRNFNIEPTGHWLLAAGRDSNTVAVFKIDQESGELSYQRGSSIMVPTPICVLFGRIATN